MSSNESPEELATRPPSSPPQQGVNKGRKESTGTSQESLPESFGRYRVVRLLGKGGFGQVYLARDEQLRREVAVKVTLAQFFGGQQEELILNEARVLAALDHPHIVPVYDVGQTAGGDLYIVSKLIDGSDLAKRIKTNRPGRFLSLKIVESVAEALHYAHARGLVHRDVKPANILLDRHDRPYLADFGIALRENERYKPGSALGTPAYMSPEQARGEGHRVDNRSDIYSLGVVLYELMAGRPPFFSESLFDLMELVASEDVRTPRLYEPSIPPELERICLKALARRASDRFSVARDLAEELRWVQANRAETPGVALVTPAEGFSQMPHTPASPLTPVSPLTPPLSLAPQVGDTDRAIEKTRTGPTRVVPKGLRSFDAGDASFFLELLPGPFDREGLPDSLRFWKTRIEQTDSEKTFAVGVLYGPSGCGKSSLVKAGLLPRLSPQVVTVYLEASGEDFEGRVLRAVRKAIPDAKGGTLAEALATIRRRRLVPSGGKLLLVLDQFEQWLFAQSSYKTAGLTNALKQCDGGMVQTLLLVRDDFWISLSRLLGELDIPLLERENSAMVDLFDLDHAAKVLGLFGRALGKLPESSQDWSSEQKQFVRAAVEGLGEDRKVISVRLAVFAEMMKTRDWTPAALREVGGISGVGETFLEETFGARHAPLQHRRHEVAVRGLLAALLPASGTDIKGAMRSAPELQAAAGYERQPREFAELLGILDKSLRLITPVDLEERDRDRSTIVPNRGEVQGDTAFKSDSPRAAEQLGQLLYDRSTIVPNRGEVQGDTAFKSDSPCAAEQLGQLLYDRSTIVPNRGEVQGDTAFMSDSPRAAEQLGQLLYYQLAHDYLVPSLREWLTRKQRETKKGRAELKLAERTAVWLAKPENKQLPTLVEWFQIWSRTERKRWTASEQKLMKTAARVHARNWGGSLLVLALLTGMIGYSFQQVQRRSEERAIMSAIASLQGTLGSSVPRNIDNLVRYDRPELIRSELEQRYQATTDANEKLALAFGLAHFGKVEVDYLVSRIDSMPTNDRGNLIQALSKDRQRAIEELQQAASACTNEASWQLKARLALLALGLGETGLAKDMCEFEGRTDHGARTWFIEEFPSWELDLGQIIDNIASSDSPALRSAICLGMGGIAAGEIPAESRTRMTELAQKWYQDQPDSLSHSAAGWLLRQWEVTEPRVEDAASSSGRDWFVNSQGVTFVRITMSPAEPEPLPDPLEPYRQRLRELESLPVDQQSQLENRYMRGESLYWTGQYEAALSELDGKWEDWAGEGRKEVLRLRLLSLAKLKHGKEAEVAMREWTEAEPAKGDLVAYIESIVPLWLGRKEEAVQRLERAWAEAESAEASSRYNIACLTALFAASESATVEEKTAWSERALSLLEEWSDGDESARVRMREDPDLLALHVEPRFRKLAAVVEVQDKTYWLANREVTRGEFEQFLVHKTKSNGPQDPDSEVVAKVSPTTEHPAQNCSWYDAVEYCNWLSEIEGRKKAYSTLGKELVKDRNDRELEVEKWELDETADGYRLPREAEWEYACRAGSETDWSAGSDELLLARYCQMYPSKESARCGWKLPNAWGLHDMHGNVWEWCWDNGGSDRVYRGGCWEYVAADCRSAFRDGTQPSVRFQSGGFRVAIGSPSGILRSSESDEVK